jgi:hypothetical protein
MKNYWYLIVLLSLFASCDKEVVEIAPLSGELPLLNGNQKIGIITGFYNPPADYVNDSIQARWDEAVQSGMSVCRLQIDWTELEPSPNQYNKSVLEEALADMNNQGLQTFLLISAYDSEGAVVPTDLEGKDFDDEELIGRYQKLMDWVIPMLVEYNGYLISITNEADNAFEDNPNLHKQIKTFATAVRNHINEINKSIAVTVTFAAGNMDAYGNEITKILEVCDIACWNFYGSKANASFPPYSSVMAEAEIIEKMQKIVDASGSKNIVFQELGLHSGDEHIGSSEEKQRNFFEVFFTEMKNQNQIKVAYIWQMVDWDAELAQSYVQPLADEGIDPVFIDEFSESLTTIGLIKHTDGTRKKAWNEFINRIKSFK